MEFTEKLTHQIPTIQWAYSSVIYCAMSKNLWLVTDSRAKGTANWCRWKEWWDEWYKCNGMGCKKSSHVLGWTEFPYLTGKLDPTIPSQQLYYGICSSSGRKCQIGKTIFKRQNDHFWWSQNVPLGVNSNNPYTILCKFHKKLLI